MPNQLALKDDSEIVLENVVSLKKFPPKLRKLGKFMLESHVPMSIAHACDAIELNLESVYQLMYRCRKKGNDFQEFINQQGQTYLHSSKLGVFKGLVNGAVSSTPQATSDRKLYFQLTGDLKESTNLNINHLTIGVNIQGVLPQDHDRNKGVIDVQPIIPKLK